MIEINWTLLIQIVNFLILIFFLNLIVYKPIRSMLKQRKSKFENLENDIVAIGADAEMRNQSFGDGIKAARQEGQSQKEAMLKAAADEEKNIVAQINAKSQEEMAAMKKIIARDINEVRNALEKEIDVFADAIAIKILGRTA